MEIQEAILHRITKEKNTTGAGSATTQKRATHLTVDSRLERTVNDILKIYGKSTNGYGTFDGNETVHRFPVLLRDNLTGQSNFIAFTCDTTDLIAAKMGDEAFSTGGYSLFLRYTNQGQDWMLVAMLKLKPGTGAHAEPALQQQTIEHFAVFDGVF